MSISASPAIVIMGWTLRFPAWSSRGGDQVTLVPLAPGPGPGGRPGHHAPVIGETLMAARGRRGDDRVGPVVVGHDRLGHAAAVGAAQPAGVQEDPEPRQRTALPAVGDVLLVLQRRPGARGRGEVPDRAA